MEATIHEHCRIRGWVLHAVNCRSNHLHVVVTANIHPDEVREQLKAWCTRRLKDLERWRRQSDPARQRPSIRQEWWAERGSRRFITDDESLEAAIVYTHDGQDRER